MPISTSSNRLDLFVHSCVETLAIDFFLQLTVSSHSLTVPVLYYQINLKVHLANFYISFHPLISWATNRSWQKWWQLP